MFIFNPALLLIGVESIWHALLIFAVSLLAILAFASLTNNWMLVRNRLWESLALVVVIVALFRPSLLMDRIYPPFAEVPPQSYASGELLPEPGQIIRFHVTRETPYGDRFKLFALQGAAAAPSQATDPLGLRLTQGADNRWRVAGLSFNGTADQAGMDFGDVVTAIEIERPGQPPKELVYPFGLLLFGFCLHRATPAERSEKPGLN